jgi:hypothetical protein
VYLIMIKAFFGAFTIWSRTHLIYIINFQIKRLPSNLMMHFNVGWKSDWMVHLSCIGARVRGIIRVQGSHGYLCALISCYASLMHEQVMMVS